MILNWPGTCEAMYAASTAVRWSLRNTFDAATVITKSVSSSGGTSPSSRRQVTAGVSIGLMPPMDSRMPVIQLARRTSPSVNTRIPAARWAAMFSSVARSSAARSSPSLIAPALYSARAVSSQGCRSRLPTCSA